MQSVLFMPAIFILFGLVVGTINTKTPHTEYATSVSVNYMRPVIAFTTVIVLAPARGLLNRGYSHIL